MGFALVATAVLGLAGGWAAVRLSAGLPEAAGRAFAVAVALMLLSVPVGAAALQRGGRTPLHRALAWTTWTSLAALSLLFTWTAAGEAARLAFLAARAALGGPPPGPEGPGLALLAVGTTVATIAAGAVLDRGPPRVHRVEVPVAGLPAALDGLRIAHLSDLHLDALDGRAFLEDVVERVRDLEPDIVAITGDLADGDAGLLRPEAEPLRRLPRPAFFVTGNHEYYSGVEGWTALVRELGVVVLENEHRVVSVRGGRIVVAGVPDHRAADFVPAHRPDPARALAGAPAGLPVVLLAHQPRTAPAALAAGADLVLAGHTHGGQFPPWTWVVRAVEPFAAGLHRAGRGHVFTLLGTGTWGPPVRLGAPREIGLVVLRRAPGEGDG